MSARSFVYVSGGEYRFRLTADLVIDLDRKWTGCHEFFQRGTKWARLVDDRLTIFAGYAWDGCSPAWKVCGKWYGTPTPASAVLPSLVHDVLYQFLGMACAPWDKATADDIFYNLMVEGDFRLRGTYHGAVAVFGSIFRRLSPKPALRSCGVCERPSD